MTGGPERPHGRAGHEEDREFVDKDVAADPDVEREGAFVDKDVAVDAPAAEREGDYTDKDVAEDDPGTPPSSYVAKDVPS